MFYIRRRKKIKVLIKSRLIKLFRLVRIAKYSAYVKKFMFNKNKKFFYWNKVHLHFVLFLLMYVNAKIIIGKTSLWSIPSRNTILRRIYYAGGSKFEVEWWLEAACLYLRYIFQLITKFNKIYCNFYLTNNNCVNAKFLSRYIARKLQQGYPIKVLLNPIKKELLYLLAISTMPHSSFARIGVKKYIKNKVKSDMIKSLFKIMVSYIFVNFRKIRKYNLLKEKNYLTLDLLMVYLWLNDLVRNKINLKNFARVYFQKKIIYICFFENTNFFVNSKNLIYPKLSNIYLLAKEDKFLNFFDWIYDYIIVNKFNLKSNIMFDEQSSSLRGLGLNLSRFFKYYYLNYCYKSGYQSLNVNFLKSRIKKTTKGTNLMGYKMYLMGRFTRKQRAGHLWFSKGRTPLTSVMSFVDFAYHSLALKNSTITVKIWLYKNNDLDNRYYLKMI